MPWMLRLLNLLLARPAWIGACWYARRHPEKYGDGWPQRFGDAPVREGGKRCVWVHAVSVGEVNATRTLVRELERAAPDVEVVVSATTRTGMDAARRLYPQRLCFFYPLDFPWTVRRVLDRVRPDLILLMELEVWPNLLAACRRRGVPVCIVNGRVTEERSMKRFRRPVVRSLARWMFSNLEWIAAQDEAYAARFRELGASAERVHAVGSMKWDTAEIADSIPGDAELATAMGIDRARPVWVAGSTGPDEEAILLDALRRLLPQHPGLQLVIVPRKPERFDDVARLIEQGGFAVVRRSLRKDAAVVAPAELGAASAVVIGIGPSSVQANTGTERATLTPAPSLEGSGGQKEPIVDHLDAATERRDGTADQAIVFLGDTLGELRKFYALADVVFVGRTLVPMGGSDFMEVAALGKPIVAGPYSENFADAAERLLAAGVLTTVRDAAGLAACIDGWLTNRETARAAGAAGRQVVRDNTGATGRTIERILATLG